MKLGLKRQRKRAVLVLLLLFVIVSLLIYATHIFLKRAEPTFVAQSSNYSNTAFTDLVNKCILDIIETEEFSGFFMPVSQGKRTALEADTAKINTIKSKLLINIQNALNNDYPAKLYIPLGSLTDYYLLSSLGPSITVKIIPISVVDCELVENFESVGINQIRHSVDLDIFVNMHYRAFLLDEREKITVRVPIAQTIISGDVPNYYGGTVALSDK